MADKNLDGNGLSEVWVRAAQLVKKYTGAVDSAKGDLQTQVNEKLSGTDDTKDNTVTFTSADELNPTAWKDVNVLSSKEKHLSLLNKISTMFSNVRYLYNILGTTDISALGTVTQAIATLNGNVGSIKGISSSAAITTQGQYALDAWEKNASINGTLANELSKVNSNLGTPLINDENTTLESIISQRFCGRIFSFYRTNPTSDAPVNEYWGYTYIVIPIDGSVHMVVAYRAYTSSSMYQRTIDSNGWSGSWYKYQGTIIPN